MADVMSPWIELQLYQMVSVIAGALFASYAQRLFKKGEYFYSYIFIGISLVNLARAIGIALNNLR